MRVKEGKRKKKRKVDPESTSTEASGIKNSIELTHSRHSNCRTGSRFCVIISSPTAYSFSCLPLLLLVTDAKTGTRSNGNHV